MDDPASADVFQSPQTRAIWVSSEALDAGQTPAQWLAANVPDPATTALPKCFQTPQTWEHVTVDGHQGGLQGGDFGCSFTQAIVIADGRAYVFKAMPDPQQVNTQIFDQGLFDAFLAGVRFTGG